VYRHIVYGYKKDKYLNWKSYPLNLKSNNLSEKIKMLQNNIK